MNQSNIQKMEPSQLSQTVSPIIQEENTPLRQKSQTVLPKKDQNNENLKSTDQKQVLKHSSTDNIKSSSTQINPQPKLNNQPEIKHSILKQQSAIKQITTPEKTTVKEIKFQDISPKHSYNEDLQISAKTNIIIIKTQLEEEKYQLVQILAKEFLESNEQIMLNQCYTNIKLLVQQAQLLPESLEVLELFCNDYPHLSYPQLRQKYFPLLNKKDKDNDIYEFMASETGQEKKVGQLNSSLKRNFHKYDEISIPKSNQSNEIKYQNQVKNEILLKPIQLFSQAIQELEAAKIDALLNLDVEKTKLRQCEIQLQGEIEEKRKLLDENYKLKLNYQERLQMNNQDQEQQKQLQKNIAQNQQDQINKLNQLLLEQEYQIRKHVEEKNALKKSLDQANQNYISWNETTKYQNEQIQKFTIEYEQLKNKLNEVKVRDDKQIQMLEESIKKLQKEKIELETANYSKDRMILTLQSKLEDHQHNTKLYSLQLQQLEHLQNENKSLHQAFQDSEKQRIHLLEENIELKNEVKQKKLESIQQSRIFRKPSPRIFEVNPRSITPTRVSPLEKSVQMNVERKDSTAKKKNASYSQSDQQLQLSPLQRNLIYPYQDPRAYYRNKIKKSSKGKLSNLKQFIPRDMVITSTNLSLMRSACFQQSEILYQSSEIEIYQIIEPTILNGVRMLSLKLTYTSRRYQLNLTLNYEFSKMLSVQPLSLNNEKAIINPSQKVLHSFAFNLNSPLVTCSKVVLKYDEQEEIVMLPITLIQFLDWVSISAGQFKDKWKKSEQKIRKSPEFKYNQNLIEETINITNLIKEMVLLNPQKQEEFTANIDELKFGGVCFLRLTGDFFLIRLVFTPLEELIVQASSNDEKVDEQVIDMIISTLKFLFSQ